MATTVRAAGGVVYRRTRGGFEVVVVHRPRYDDWSLPKGKIDAGEGALDGALREVREETGLACRVDEELPPIEYTDLKGRPKNVRYWLMEATDDDEERGPLDEEVDVLDWLAIPEALPRLTYPLDREVLQAAATRLGVVAPARSPDTEHLAAVDLGSNSFRLVIARTHGEGLESLDRLREGVRLAASLDSSRRLTDEGQERALAALSRFGQRIRELPGSKVRAVGTNTLRRAKNAAPFLERAEATLGHPIEVVSGAEEARLIYVGVWHSVPATREKRLVVDIGGGSTELVVGEAHEPRRTESLFMGCVSWSERYFGGGKVKRDAFKKAVLAARLEVQPVAKELRREGWEECYGASGTVKAIETLLLANGWTTEGITYAGMKKLRKEILGCKRVEDLDLVGLSADRARVLPGGLAILMGVFRGLEIERMKSSPGALREGLLYDLLGRIRHRDIRDPTIARLVDRYGVDVEQAERVKATSLDYLGQVEEAWGLDPELGGQFLSWAASLHEIGIALSHGGYHKHGSYLVENSDLPGFSRQDQALLAVLIRGHRRKLKRSAFEELAGGRREFALRLCILLRLAVLMNRSRSSRTLPAVDLVAGERRVELGLPESWLERHSLSRADLEQEAKYLANVGYELALGDD